MRIYLVRHGSTSWNAKHMIQGRTDTSLDDVGYKMAEQTGMKFISDGIVFDKVYSSPLKRAYDTAALLSPGSEIITDDRLVELSFGPYEGKVVEDMIKDPDCAFRYFKQAPNIYDDLVREMNDRSIESLTDLNVRAADFLREKIEPLASTDERILISGHGALNKGLMMHINGNTDMSLFWGDELQSNCGITMIDLDADGYRITGSNITLYDPDLKKGTVLFVTAPDDQR